MNYHITPKELKNMQSKEEIVIIDVRSHLQNPDLGESLYKKSHIPTAFYLHLKKDLSSEMKEHGGNHPLPHINELAKKLGEMGVNHEIKVVFYDEDNGMYAARAWFLLYYMGHENSYVLDGGFAGWTKAGYDVTDEIPTNRSTVFQPRLKTDIIISMENVRERDIKKKVLIDSRTKERYLGKKEPLYEKAGHIPGAKHYFWQDVLDEQGNYKEKEQLKAHFAHLKEDDEIIVSCGSGISACSNFLALKMAGFNNVKLYPGSFSDWISYPENELETKEE